MTEPKQFVQMDKYRRIIQTFTLDQVWGTLLKVKLNKLKEGEETPFTGTTVLKRLTPIHKK